MSEGGAGVDPEWLREARQAFCAQLIFQRLDLTPSPAAPRPAPADPYPGITQAADFLAAAAGVLWVAAKHEVLGDWSDEKNELGETAQIATGLTPLDTAADIRDASKAAYDVYKSPNDTAAKQRLMIYGIAAAVPFVSGAMVAKMVGKAAGEGGEGAAEALARREAKQEVEEGASQVRRLDGETLGFWKKQYRNGNVTEDQLREMLHPDDVNAILHDPKKKSLGLHDKDKIIESVQKSEDALDQAAADFAAGRISREEFESALDQYEGISEAQKDFYRRRFDDER